MPSTAVSGIVVSHSNPDKIFILTGSGDDANGGFVYKSGYRNSGFGVAVSNNGGDDWSYCAPFPDPDNPNNNLTSCSGYKLVQHPLMQIYYLQPRLMDYSKPSTRVALGQPFTIKL
ncbi:MAG: hypothetical protein IPN46_15260 [Saprospiraceae bacterium]|nr:hypothetical protein [Saprospiraceae bacterium]